MSSSNHQLTQFLQDLEKIHKQFMKLIKNIDDRMNQLEHKLASVTKSSEKLQEFVNQHFEHCSQQLQSVEMELFSHLQVNF